MPKNYSGKNIVSIVRDLIEPIIFGLGYKIWDVTYEKQGPDKILCVTIDTDKPEGIFINDCEIVHRAIETVIDEADPIPDSYSLQVSSPGLERDLRLPEHFNSVIGKEILVKLYNKKSYGSNSYRGILLSFDNDELTLSQGLSENIIIKFSDISRANTVIDF